MSFLPQTYVEKDCNDVPAFIVFMLFVLKPCTTSHTRERMYFSQCSYWMSSCGLLCIVEWFRREGVCHEKVLKISTPVSVLLPHNAEDLCDFKGCEHFSTPASVYSVLQWTFIYYLQLHSVLNVLWHMITPHRLRIQSKGFLPHMGSHINPPFR